MGPKNSKWWKCNDEMMSEYRERIRAKYEQLDAEKGTVEGEWRQYKDAFVGGWRRSCVVKRRGEGDTPRSRNQGWWTEAVAKVVEEKREACILISGIRDRGRSHPPA